MKYATLGNTGLTVSRLCFGTLTIGPLQAALPIDEGAAVIVRAIERGVTFFDTAQLYGSYPYLRRAMELTGRYDLVIATKTYAHTRELAREALIQAQTELDRDVIDIFLLHEQESIHTLRGHREALEYLLECRQKGIIRAAGASMHHVAAVRGAIDLGLDVIHPPLNIEGLGIADGDRYDMERAVETARKSGIGVYTMKPLGGGNLWSKAERCLDYAFSYPFADSVALGMQGIAEVDANIGFLEDGAFSPSARRALEGAVRRLHVDGWCEGCGRCVERCSQKALSLRGGIAVCDHERCILCCYCAGVCPSWAIKVV